LARRISVQVGLIALATSIMQLAMVIGHNYFDYEDLSLGHVKREIRWLLAGVSPQPAGLSFELPSNATHYQSYPAQYAFRILEGTGRLIAASQPSLLKDLTPSQTLPVPGHSGFWFRKLDGANPFYFAGGEQFHMGGHDVVIEVATLGDPAGIHWWIVAYETLEDLWLPILPFTLLIPMATLVTVRRALNFLARAAQQAAKVDPSNPQQRIDLTGIPREARAFAVAINRLLQGASDHIRSKQNFMARAAHQLRTPLAAMMLELEKIDTPRARGIERDVVGMSSTVDRLLTLVRLQTIEAPDFVMFNIGAVAEDAVQGLRGWAAAREHDLQVRVEGSGSLLGDPVALRDALVNLVENAVKHTPHGTAVRVTAGPGKCATVEDSGPGLPPESREQLFQPFRRGNGPTGGYGLGLAIVREAVDLHGGTLRLARSPMGGAMFTLTFA
jgi:signal transduction histidine kinase